MYGTLKKIFAFADAAKRAAAGERRAVYGLCRLRCGGICRRPPCRQKGGGRPVAAGGGCGGVSVRRTMAYCAGRYAAVFHPRLCRDGVGIRRGAAGGPAGQKEREASGGRKAPQGGEGVACHRERAAVT